MNKFLETFPPPLVSSVYDSTGEQSVYFPSSSAFPRFLLEAEREFSREENTGSGLTD